MNEGVFRLKALLAAFLLHLVCALPVPVAAAVDSGLDTPTGVTSLPFSIQGTQIMALTGTGLGIGGGGINPTQALDVDGYVRIRAINGEGGTIQLDGNNGTTVWAENINGNFRLVNSPWNAELFSVDQSGDANIDGSATVNGSNLVMTACPSWAHFAGSYVGDGCDGTLHLHSGGSAAEVDNANLTVNGTVIASNGGNWGGVFTGAAGVYGQVTGGNANWAGEFVGTNTGGSGGLLAYGGGANWAGLFWGNASGNGQYGIAAQGTTWAGYFMAPVVLTSGYLQFPDGSQQTTAASKPTVSYIQNIGAGTVIGPYSFCAMTQSACPGGCTQRLALSSGSPGAYYFQVQAQSGQIDAMCF